MRACFVLAMLVGCGGVPAAAPLEVVVKDAPVAGSVALPERPPPAAPPAEPLFDAEATSRARVASWGALYAVPPGRGVSAINPQHQRRPVWQNHRPWPVMEARDGSLRIRVEHPAITLVVYASRDDFLPVARRTVRLAFGDASPNRDDEGVFVRAGTHLPGKRDGARVLVTVEEGGLRLDGNLPAHAVGQVYEPDERALSAGPRIPPRTVIRFGDGRPLITSGSEPWPVDVGGEQDGQSAVVFRGERLEVRGWVATDAVSQVGLRNFGTRGCRLARPLPPRRDRWVLHRGDRLRDVASGAVFARVEQRRLEAEDLGPRGEGRRVRVRLASYGHLEAWLDAEDAEFARRYETAYEAQASISWPADAGPVPPILNQRRHQLYACADAVRGYGREEQVTLELTWKGGSRVDVPPGRMRPDVHDCVLTAFAELDEPSHPPTPFTVKLDPRPLPAR